MKKIIILGTAHLATTPGKCSPDKKFREYKFSREVVKMIEKELRLKGYTVYIDYLSEYPNDKMKNSTEELKWRVDYVNDLCKKLGTSNCVYISIHVNAAGGDGKWHNASGFSAFVSSNASDNSKRLAKILTNKAVAADLGGNRCIPVDRYWTKDLYVLKNTKCPAVLTENLFQDNKEDVEFLMSNEGKEAIKKLHVDSIEKYCSNIL